MTVLVLGGGMAGAAAALRLADLGHAATVIEARPSAGGRAMSAGAVELGGGWLRREHGALRALAERVGIGLRARSAVTRRVWFTAAGPQAAPFPAEEAEAYAAAMARLTGEAPALTLAAWMDRHRMPPSARRELLAWWAISGAGDPGRILVEELFSSCSYGPNPPEGIMDALALTVEGGVQGLVQAVLAASRAAVIAGDPVVSVRQGATVVARLRSGRAVSGRAAVVALPVAVLGDLAFDPPLSDAPAVWAREGHEGRSVKMVAEVEAVEPGVLATGEAFGWRWMWTDRTTDGRVVLTAFGRDGEARGAALAAAVACALPGARLGQLHGHDWSADPFARGAWVAPPAAEAWAYRPAPAQGALHFAGSDIAGKAQGWFEGAVLSGQAAAEAIAGGLGHG